MAVDYGELEKILRLPDETPIWPTNTEFRRLLYLGDGIFVVGYEAPPGKIGGIFRSADYGKSWRQVYQGTRHDGTRFTKIDGVVLASGYQYVQRSVDRGLTWVEVYDAGVDVRLDGLATLSSSVALAGTRYNGENEWTRAAILKSVDRGRTWSHVSNMPGKSHIYEMVGVDESTALASCDDGTVYKTRDAGLSWYEVLNLGGGRIYGFVKHAGRIYVAINTGDTRIFISEDGGESWSVFTDLADVSPPPNRGYKCADKTVLEGRTYLLYGNSGHSEILYPFDTQTKIFMVDAETGECRGYWWIRNSSGFNGVAAFESGIIAASDSNPDPSQVGLYTGSFPRPNWIDLLFDMIYDLRWRIRRWIGR